MDLDLTCWCVDRIICSLCQLCHLMNSEFLRAPSHCPSEYFVSTMRHAAPLWTLYHCNQSLTLAGKYKLYLCWLLFRSERRRHQVWMKKHWSPAGLLVLTVVCRRVRGVASTMACFHSHHAKRGASRGAAAFYLSPRQLLAIVSVNPRSCNS